MNNEKISEEKVLECLSEIRDPDLNQDIVSLDFIKNLEISGGVVSFTIELTTPACPVKEEFRSKAEELVGMLPGVSQVAVTMGVQKKHSSAGSTPASANLENSGLAGVDSMVAIASCKGGVGKSTISATIACELAARGYRVGLLDLDIFGPSLPTLFSLHQHGVASKDKKLIPIDGPHNLKLMSFGFLLGDSPAIMRGAMVSNYISQLLFQVDWGKLDYLFIDLPPGTGDTQLTVSQQIPLDGAVMITTNQALSLVDVARGILMFEKVQIPMLGLLQNMDYYVCGKCEERHYPFGRNDDALTHKFGIKSIKSLPFLSREQMHFEDYQSYPLATELVDNLIREIGKKKKERKHLPKIKLEDGKLKISWSDELGMVEKTHEVDYHTLRVNCGCAICQDEYSGERKLDPDSVSKEITPMEVTPLGNYALSIVWDDGHSAGIYSYALIESLAS